VSSPAADSFAVQKAMAAAVIGAVAILLGYLLADNPVLAILVVLGPLWLLTLPYHSQISIHVAIATFFSALIIPFLPGRIHFWEAAALLGWSGMLITLFLRREHPAMGTMLRSNALIYIGVVGYCIVLLITMYYRGFGLRIFGGEQMGGRFYIQQLICAVFPFLLAAHPTSERTLTRLFYLQCLLVATFLISEFALARPTSALLPLLQFFELSTDALTFEMQAEQFGIRRFQSMALISGAMIYFLWARYGLKAFLSEKGAVLLPVGAILLILGLFSGHRYLFVILILAFLFCSYTQRLFTLRNALILGVAALLATISIYVLAERLPLAAQRAVSFLPGIDVHSMASQDARATLEMRRLLRNIGIEMAPDYFWVGRGLGFSATGDAFGTASRDPLMWHINIGRFYNGFVGLLVNTGIFGTLFMLTFLTGGTILAVRIIRLLREHRWEDPFALVCSVIVSLWLARVIGWLLLHGDSEWALKNFGLQAAMMVACHYHLTQRLQSEDPREAPASSG
jgi:hypothetical protein